MNPSFSQPGGLPCACDGCAVEPLDQTATLYWVGNMPDGTDQETSSTLVTSPSGEVVSSPAQDAESDFMNWLNSLDSTVAQATGLPDWVAPVAAIGLGAVLVFAIKRHKRRAKRR